MAEKDCDDGARGRDGESMRGHPIIDRAEAGRESHRNNTIEEIEARAAQVIAEERQVLGGLVLCLRELAVYCPPEGRLGLHLAAAAKSIEPWLAGGEPASITGLDQLLRALERDMPGRED